MVDLLRCTIILPFPQAQVQIATVWHLANNDELHCQLVQVKMSSHLRLIYRCFSQWEKEITKGDQQLYIHTQSFTLLLFIIFTVEGL